MITRENVKVFVVDGLGYITGEVVLNDKSVTDGIALKHPFRLTPGQDGSMSVGPVFVKEEFVTLNPSKVIAELDVDDAIYDVYQKYCQKIWSSIVLPDNYNSGLKLV